LHQRLGSSPAPAEADEYLLRRFLHAQDQAAFEALVRRHGPMVWGVCRRLLGHEHDADDAFQPTFLVLVHKAASVRRRESLGSWLYGVAGRIARRARADADHRREIERRTVPAHPADPAADAAGREVSAVLDEELARLPQRFREPLVLCCLEGLSKAGAARQLGWKEGTVASRLARGRERLRARLARRGILVPAGALGTALAEQAPAAVAAATVKAATLFLAGIAPTRATLLMKGASRAVWLSQLRVVAALGLLLTVVAVGLSLPAHPAPGTPAAGERAGQPEPTRKPGEAAPPRADLFGDPLPPGALVRLGTVRLRHRFAPAVFSADGKTLISAGADHEVRRWDVATGRPLRRQPLHTSLPLTMPVIEGDTALSADGKTVAVWGRKALHLWDGVTGKEIRRIPAEAPLPVRFALSPEGKTLATVDVRAPGVRLWDVATGTERFLLGHPSLVERIAFAPDGKLLATAGVDHCLRLWDVAVGKELQRVSLGKDRAACLAFTPDGRRLAVGRQFGAGVLLFEAATLREQDGLQDPGTYLSCLAFSPDGRRLAGAGQKFLCAWDVATRQRVYKVPYWTGSQSVTALAFTPDGSVLASSAGSTIRLWEAATGKQRLRQPGHEQEVSAVAVSPDGKVVASIAAIGERTIRLWDVATGKPLHALEGHEASVNRIGFSPDGKYLISGGGDATVLFWDVATGKEVRRFRPEGPKRGLEAQVMGFALSPDGRQLAAKMALIHGVRALTPICVWDVASGKLLAGRDGPADWDCLFTPDGKGIVVRTDAGFVLQDTVRGVQLAAFRIPGDPGNVGAFSPDGKLLAVSGRQPFDPTTRTGGDVNAIYLFATATGRQQLRIPTGPFGPVAFSRDGQLLATADTEAVRLWEVVSGKELFRLPRHEPFRGSFGPSFVSCLAFLPSGRALATGLVDGTVLVWDLTPEAATAANRGRQELERLWADLAGEDGLRAYRAVHALAASPAQAVALVQDRCRPAVAVEPQRVERLLTDLDSERFAVREAAAKELARLREQVAPALIRALEGKPTAEVRKRLETILAAPRAVPPGPTLQTLRAIRVLEHVGKSEARRVLRQLATGDPLDLTTRSAREALDRLNHRPASAP
jgi:RNA polymerase sigma factor (sigma-70 family)